MGYAVRVGLNVRGGGHHFAGQRFCLDSRYPQSRRGFGSGVRTRVIRRSLYVRTALKEAQDRQQHSRTRSQRSNTPVQKAYHLPESSGGTAEARWSAGDGAAHVQVANQAVQIGYVQAEPARRFGQIAAGTFDGPFDQAPLQITDRVVVSAGRHGQG